MASISVELGRHWEEFIKEEIKSGRYSSAEDVICAALGELEARSRQLGALRAHLAEGAGQATRRDFVEDFDVRDVIRRARIRAQAD